MSHKPVPRWATILLTAGAVFLPIAILVILATGELLGAMGDALGGTVLRRVALAGGLIWVIDLLGLLLLLALASLGDDGSP
jgi:hypothetical protein